MKLEFRALCILGGIISISVLTFAYLLEYGFNLEPCPLCLLQRYVLWIIFGTFVIGAIHNGQSIARTVYCASVFLVSIIGIALSSRHVWLQYFAPPGISDCMAGLDRMLAFKPFTEVLKEILFHTSAECARIDFTVLKLSLPAWTLIGFIGFAVFSLLILIAARRTTAE
jgi:disulfide bond formation protein DsbB